MVPTLDNSYAVYAPVFDYKKKSQDRDRTSIELNEQSFLGKMEYNVHKSVSVRRRILSQTALKYGKRKVIDHIAFLIATRIGQSDGKIKYARAISIWQADINYVSEIEI